MALKTIFKGTINGKSFDSVEAYNEEMNRLISSGAIHIDASSNTTVRECECKCEPCICDDNEECKCEECKCEHVNMLPGFSENKNYLDELAFTDAEKNTKSISSLNDFLEQHIQKVINKIDKMDEHSLKNYLTDIKTVLEQLSFDYKKTKDGLKQFDKVINLHEQEIEELNKKVECLEASLDIIELFKDFYEEVGTQVNNRMHRFQSGPERDPNCEKCIQDTYPVISILEELRRLLS